MRRSIREVWDRLRNRPAGRGRPRPAATARPRLETLEDRLTPAPVILATGVISGNVFAGGGSHGLAGVAVTLTGSSTTGRTFDVSTTTDANGAYAFTQLLPGTYVVTRGGAPQDFVTGNLPAATPAISVGQGQASGNHDLGVAGLGPHLVTLAFFVSGVTPASATPPAAGAGSAAVFSLDSSNPLTAQSLALGGSSFLDLSGNFFDPDTTSTTLTFNTSQGNFNVQLFDRDAPQTVANFLNYIQAGAYNNDLFHRLSNLDFSTTKPFQVIQAGGFSVTADPTTHNVTALPALTTQFQPIADEFSALHLDTAGTIAMARGSASNSATSQFFLNLVDNSQALGAANGGGFAVFGQVVGGVQAPAVKGLANNYTPQNVTTATSNQAFNVLPLLNGFTPASNFPTGATTNDLAIINSVTVASPSAGHLTYAIVGNSNPAAVTATLGSNTATSTFSANQLKLTAGTTPGTAVITVQVTDARGESVLRQFTVTTG